MRHLVTPRNRWEDNIRMDLREIGWEGVKWICLAQDRDQCCVFVSTVMNLRVSGLGPTCEGKVAPVLN
jgi:hypothetical protein